MLRVLWFAVRIAVLVAVAVWVANRPGDITVHWMDYTVQAKAWFVLVAGLFALLAILILHRVLLSVLGFTGAVGRYREWRRDKKGQRAVLLGLAAVAAGDRKLAQYQAYRARSFMPRDRGLTLLLEGDTARLKGDNAAAHQAYSALLENKDAAFLGMRGLLTTALEHDNPAEALELARKAIAMHPKQAWLQRLVYRLEIHEQAWDAALRSLRRVEKSKAMPADAILRDRQAIYLQQAIECFGNAQARAGCEKLKQAYRLDPGFVPAAVALAEYYIESGQRRAAVKLITRSWQASPHPELTAIWTELAPPAKPNDSSIRLRWFEKLVALRPDSDESQMAAARAAIDDRLWGEARQYLAMAESIRPSARLYRLRSLMEEQLSHPSEARHWLEKAADAAADPVWTCRDTGQVYEHWSPIAEPHGSFNTIVWDYPQARRPGRHNSIAGFQPEMALLPRLRA
jgi:HemY protein